MKKQDIEDAIYELAREVAYLKETQCGNSGLNWLGSFLKEFFPDEKEV